MEFDYLILVVCFSIDETKERIVVYTRVTFSFINFVISLGSVASAMFRRLDHTHCLGILGDLWYSMSEACLKELSCDISNGISQDV
jgi:hypothetical protein